MIGTGGQPAYALLVLNIPFFKEIITVLVIQYGLQKCQTTEARR